MATTQPLKTTQHNRKINRYREMFGFKQEPLALELAKTGRSKSVQVGLGPAPNRL